MTWDEWLNTLTPEAAEVVEELAELAGTSDADVEVFKAAAIMVLGLRRRVEELEGKQCSK